MKVVSSFCGTDKEGGCFGNFLSVFWENPESLVRFKVNELSNLSSFNLLYSHQFFLHNFKAMVLFKKVFNLYSGRIFVWSKKFHFSKKPCYQSGLKVIWCCHITGIMCTNLLSSYYPLMKNGSSHVYMKLINIWIVFWGPSCQMVGTSEVVNRGSVIWTIYEGILSWWFD